MVKFRLAGRLEALKPLREAKMRGRIEKSKLKWNLREALGKASKTK